MRLALMLGKRQERGVPAVCSHPQGIVDWEASVITDVGAGNPFDLIFVEDRRPHAGQIDLRCRRRRHADHEESAHDDAWEFSRHKALER